MDGKQGVIAPPFLIVGVGRKLGCVGELEVKTFQQTMMSVTQSIFKHDCDDLSKTEKIGILRERIPI